MKLFEIRDDIVIINIDTNFLRKYNNIGTRKANSEEYNDFLIQKIKNGNQDEIIKAINIIKKILLKGGCSNYTDFYRKYKTNKEE